MLPMNVLNLYRFKLKFIDWYIINGKKFFNPNHYSMSINFLNNYKL